MNRYLLSFVAMLLGLLLLTASWVEFKTDVSDFFFRGDSPETALIASSIQSGELSRRYILLIEAKREGVDLSGFIQVLQADLNSLEHVSRVWGMDENQQDIQTILMDYLPYRMHLFSLDPAKDVPDIFLPQLLQERAVRVKTMLLSPENQSLKPLIRQDPMLLTADWALKLKRDQPGKQQHQFSGLMLETQISGLDAKAQRPIRDAMMSSFNAINATYDDAFSLRMTGVPLFAMAVQQQVAQDVQRVGMISVMLMILLFLLFFRSLRGLLWISLILLGAITSAVLLVSLVFGYVHALTIAIGATLIGVCVDYPIHAMVHAAASDEADHRASTLRIWPSLLLGGVTTLIGYIALSFTGYPGMQQIALFAGVGIAVSLLLTRFVLPHLMLGFVDKMESRIKVGIWLSCIKKYRLVMSVLVLGSGMIVFMVGYSGLVWIDDLNNLSPSLGALKAEDQSIRQRISSVEPGRFVLVQAKDFETALQMNEQVFSRLQTLKMDGGLASFHSLYPWLASERLQQDNLKAFQDNITDKHRQQWHQALREQGLSVKYLGELPLPDKEALTLEKFESWPYKNYVSGQYLVQDKQSLIMTWLGSHDQAQVMQALSGMKGVRYVSQRDIVNRLAADYRVQAVKVLLFGALMIFMLLSVRFRNIYTAFNILLPALVAVFFIVGLWGILGQAMGMLHLIGLLLAVAICVDYGVFTFENRAGNSDLTFQAIAVSAMTTIITFVSLGFAESPALEALAWAVAPGVFLGFLLCPLLIRPQSSMVEGSK